MEQDIATQVVGLGGATDFSLWKLFLRADFVVKFVIILLIALKSFNLSKIRAQEKIELAIKRTITNFTTKSARINRLHREKSEAPPNPTI